MGGCCSTIAEVLNLSFNDDSTRTGTTEFEEGGPSSHPHESAPTSADDIEILYGASYAAELVKEVEDGIKKGAQPSLFGGGTGGTYSFFNSRGESIAVVKPNDEEPGAVNNPKRMRGIGLGQPGACPYIRIGESAHREVAAYLLDIHHFAKVPKTALVNISHWVFNINDPLKRMRRRSRETVTKTASLQQYIPHDCSVDHHYRIADFLEASVHRIGILDIRICNVDRHNGNILVRKTNCGKAELIPIDHGLCLPEAFDDTSFAWLHWPQASTPFSEDELNYISNLDPFRDANTLRDELPTIREPSLRILVVCTIFLKEAASFGFFLSDIGDMMDRYFLRNGEPYSELELVCQNVKMSLVEMQALHSGPIQNEDIQFNTDTKDEERMKSHMISDESVEDEETNIDAELRGADKSGSHLDSRCDPSTSKLPESIDDSRRDPSTSKLPESIDDSRRDPSTSKLPESIDDSRHDPSTSKLPESIDISSHLGDTAPEDVQLNTDNKDEDSSSVLPGTFKERMKSPMISDEETKIDSELRRAGKSGYPLDSRCDPSTSKLPEPIDMSSHLGDTAPENKNDEFLFKDTSVGFGDMTEDAWSSFLESFRAALEPVFINHRTISNERKGE